MKAINRFLAAMVACFILFPSSHSMANSVAPTSISYDFPITPVGSTSTLTQTFTATPTAGWLITEWLIFDLQLPFPITYISGCGPNALTCTLEFNFTPTTPGNYTAVTSVTPYFGNPATGASLDIPVDIHFTAATAEIPPATTPTPAALPLFASGLGVLGLLGWRRKRRKVAAMAAA